MTKEEFEELKDKPFYLMRIKELEDKNSEYIEALREAKQIILELEGARFMKTAFYDHINKLIQ